MRRLLVVVLAVSSAACDDAVAPGSDVDLRIVSPAAGDSVWDLDPLVLLGEASAPAVGVLPDGFLWWTDNGDSIGGGRRVETRAAAGRFVFHARPGELRDSVVRTLVVRPDGLGRLLWTAPLAEQVGGDPLRLLPDGRLVARDAVYRIAVIAADGSVKLRYDLGTALVMGPPALAPDGHLVFGLIWGGPGGNGGALKWAPSGMVQWIFTTTDSGGFWPHHVHGGVAVDAAGNSYFTSEEGPAPIWSVGPDGGYRWRTSTQPLGPAEFLGWTVLVGDSLAVAPWREDSIVAVSTADGSLRWKAATGASLPLCQGEPAVGPSGTVYTMGPGWDRLVAISAAGTVLWDVPGVASLNPLVSASRIYLAGPSGGVITLSFDGGVLDTLGPPAGPGSAGASLAPGDVIYVAGPDSLVSLAADGTRRFAVAIPNALGVGCQPETSPVVGNDGTVYLRTAIGVMAFRDTVGPSTTAPWPTFQGNFQRTGRVATGN